MLNVTCIIYSYEYMNASKKAQRAEIMSNLENEDQELPRGQYVLIQRANTMVVVRPYLGSFLSFDHIDKSA